jgi:hypothetical protein
MLPLDILKLNLNFYNDWLYLCPTAENRFFGDQSERNCESKGAKPRKSRSASGAQGEALNRAFQCTQ